MRTLTLAALITAATLVAPKDASAGASGVGLGVAAGADFSRSKYQDLSATAAADSAGKELTKATFSWAFFVDIPLLSTFYITPETSLYELKLGDYSGAPKIAVTDVDLNFKFLVPLGFGDVGAGVTAGLTSGLGEHYKGHYGLFGLVSFTLVANLDAFVLVQYKRLSAGKNDPYDDIDNLHAYLGGMWKF